MIKDSMREYLAIAVEAYDLAATVPPHSIFEDTQDETESLDAPVMPTTSRRTLLNLSIDIRCIFDRFISRIEKKYGPARAERFVTWVKVGYIEQFHSDHRRMLKWDRKELQREINMYRHTCE